MFILGKGTVITMNPDSPLIKEGGVVVDGGQIAAVDDYRSLTRKFPEADRKDINGNIIMPGLINTHTHFYSTFARGIDLKTEEPPADFIDILEKLWWRLDQALTVEDIYYSASFAILESIKSGTTTVFDHHASYGNIGGSLEIIEKVVRKNGLRANLSYEISDRHGSDKSLDALKENQKFIERISENDPQLSCSLGLHASFTLAPETLNKIAAINKELGVPLHIHTAEGWADVKDSRERGYKGVVERLNDYNLWVPGSLAVHGVHLQPGELEILKNNECYLIHNPQSNMGNAVGTPPIKKALAEEVTVGLGTDGYTSNMFSSGSVAGLLQSHVQSDPGAGLSEAYEMQFVNNHKIAENFFEKDLGILKEGAPADVIVLDYNSPTPITKNNYKSHIYMGLTDSRVLTTIVRGQVLMENREVKVLNEKNIISKCRRQAKDFWQRF